jgi:hypothetical protein
MLKEGSMQNMRALTHNLWETRENGSSPVHLPESREILWDCVCPVNVHVTIYVCARWKPDPTMYIYVVQDGLRLKKSEIMLPAVQVWP